MEESHGNPVLTSTESFSKRDDWILKMDGSWTTLCTYENGESTVFTGDFYIDAKYRHLFGGMDFEEVQKICYETDEKVIEANPGNRFYTFSAVMDRISSDFYCHANKRLTPPIPKKIRKPPISDEVNCNYEGDLFMTKDQVLSNIAGNSNTKPQKRIYITKAMKTSGLPITDFENPRLNPKYTAGQASQRLIENNLDVIVSEAIEKMRKSDEKNKRNWWDFISKDGVNVKLFSGKLNRIWDRVNFARIKLMLFNVFGENFCVHEIIDNKNEGQTSTVVFKVKKSFIRDYKFDSKAAAKLGNLPEKYSFGESTANRLLYDNIFNDICKQAVYVGVTPIKAFREVKNEVDNEHCMYCMHVPLGLGEPLDWSELYLEMCDDRKAQIIKDRVDKAQWHSPNKPFKSAVTLDSDNESDAEEDDESNSEEENESDMEEDDESNAEEENESDAGDDPDNNSDDEKSSDEFEDQEDTTTSKKRKIRFGDGSTLYGTNHRVSSKKFKQSRACILKQAEGLMIPPKQKKSNGNHKGKSSDFKPSDALKESGDSSDESESDDKGKADKKAKAPEKVKGKISDSGDSSDESESDDKGKADKKAKAPEKVKGKISDSGDSSDESGESDNEGNADKNANASEKAKGTGRDSGESSDDSGDSSDESGESDDGGKADKKPKVSEKAKGTGSDSGESSDDSEDSSDESGESDGKGTADTKPKTSEKAKGKSSDSGESSDESGDSSDESGASNDEASDDE